MCPERLSGKDWIAPPTNSVMHFTIDAYDLHIDMGRLNFGGEFDFKRHLNLLQYKQIISI